MSKVATGFLISSWSPQDPRVLSHLAEPGCWRRLGEEPGQRRIDLLSGFSLAVCLRYWVCDLAIEPNKHQK